MGRGSATSALEVMIEVEVADIVVVNEGVIFFLVLIILGRVSEVDGK